MRTDDQPTAVHDARDIELEALIRTTVPPGPSSNHPHRAPWRRAHRPRVRRAPSALGEASGPPDPSAPRSLHEAVLRAEAVLESEAVLRAEAVLVRFGGLTALDGVDLAVNRGAISGLIGPNGAGKTTMFNVLCGLVTPSGGQVFLEGTDVTSWPPHRRARAGLARTFQRLELFTAMTVEDNLVAAWESAHRGAVFGRGRDERRRRVAEVVDLLDLHRLLGRRAGELPTGLGRMVELGRALCSDPTVILLDEPGSGLDARETARFREVLRAMVGTSEQPPAVLLVEHDMSLVMEVCDQVTVLDFGKRIACGPAAAIRRDPAVRAAYLGDSDVA